mmetsp:Transcript_4927/g.17610  ORF Transcript_4927/g.17610 Transcript_4927/m.17610 type:complete len:233 (+) Transcript_4927:3778-4476(+)
MLAAERVEEAPRRPRVFPRVHSRAEKLWPARMEHPVRLQRPGPENLAAAAPDVLERGVPGPAARRAVEGARVPRRRVQLRRSSHGRPRPSDVDDDPHGRRRRPVPRQRHGRRVRVLPEQEFLRAAGGGLRVVLGVFQIVADRGGTGGFRTSRQRGHHEGPGRDGLDLGFHLEHARERELGRREEQRRGLGGGGGANPRQHPARVRPRGCELQVPGGLLREHELGALPRARSV